MRLACSAIYNICAIMADNALYIPGQCEQHSPTAVLGGVGSSQVGSAQKTSLQSIGWGAAEWKDGKTSRYHVLICHQMEIFVFCTLNIGSNSHQT